MAALIVLPGNRVMSLNLLTASGLWPLFERRVQKTPDALMLIEGESGKRVTFSQAYDIAERLAAGFFERGIHANTVVTWQLPTGIQAVITSLALARLGAIQNPVIHLFGQREVRLVLERTRSAFLIVESTAHSENNGLSTMLEGLGDPPDVIFMSDERPQARKNDLPPVVTDDTPRWVYYTSGTTSEPKGAMHLDTSLLLGGRNLAAAIGATDNDVGTIAFPIAHIGGAMYLAMVLASGMSVVLLRRFDPPEACAIFRRWGVTTTGGSTPHYQALLNQQGKQSEALIPSLRVISGGGAPKPPQLYYDIKQVMNCALLHNFGMTEVPLIAAGSSIHTDEQLANTDGFPVEGVEVRIMTANGGRAKAGEAGEVRVRGAGTFKGYTDSDLNESAFDEDGFFCTGDLGILRDDGHLVLTGRQKDLIIRKGENISAQEIENILVRHPKVASAAVIGLPDSERGERVCAVVELVSSDEPFTFDEMVAFFHREGVMKQKIPEQLEIMEELPRSQALNKVVKTSLVPMFS